MADVRDSKKGGSSCRTTRGEARRGEARRGEARRRKLLDAHSVVKIVVAPTVAFLYLFTFSGCTQIEEESSIEAGEVEQEINGDGDHNDPVVSWNDENYVERKRATASITIDKPGGGSGSCSGIAIDRYHVLTAGHCITDIFDGDLYHPYGGGIEVAFGRGKYDDTIEHRCDDSMIKCREVGADGYTPAGFPDSGCDCVNPVVMGYKCPDYNPSVNVYPEDSDLNDYDIADDMAVLLLERGLHNYKGGSDGIRPYDWFKCSYNDDYDGDDFDIVSPDNDDWVNVLGYGLSDCDAHDDNGDTSGALIFGHGFRVDSAGDDMGAAFEMDGVDYGEERVWVCPGDSGGPVFNGSGQLLGTVFGVQQVGADHYSVGVEIRHGGDDSHWSWIADRILTNRALHDSDDDNVYEWEDNCPNDKNSAQKDSDSDGLGNACDPCTNSIAFETPSTVSSKQICSSNPSHPNCQNDTWGPDQWAWAYYDNDGDGIPNICDNCAYDANPDQADIDGDSKTTHGMDFMFTGDACDPDPALVLVGTGSLLSKTAQIFPEPSRGS